MLNMKSKFFPKYTAIISGSITALICLIMNIILIPRIEMNTQGIRCFDMNFPGNYENALKFLDLIGDEGRNIYLFRQIPLDFIYPVFYTVLFVSLIYILANGKARKILSVFPLILAVCDYAENIMSIIMLRSGIPSESFYAAASAFTAVKTVIMYLIFAAILVLLIMYIVNRFSKRKKGENEI